MPGADLPLETNSGQLPLEGAPCLDQFKQSNLPRQEFQFIQNRHQVVKKQGEER